MGEHQTLSMTCTISGIIYPCNHGVQRVHKNQIFAMICMFCMLCIDAASQILDFNSTVFSYWLLDDHVTSVDHTVDGTCLSSRSDVCTWQTSRRTLEPLGCLERRAGLAAREDRRMSLKDKQYVGRQSLTWTDEVTWRHALMFGPVKRHRFCSCKYCK